MHTFGIPCTALCCRRKRDLLHLSSLKNHNILLCVVHCVQGSIPKAVVRQPRHGFTMCSLC